MVAATDRPEVQQRPAGFLVAEPGGLTVDQLRFLAWRPLSHHDRDAAKSVGVHPDVITQWKREDDLFLLRYNEVFRDGVTTAVEYCRRLLGQAAETLGAGLLATRETPDGRQVPDWTARHACARTLLQTHGLIRERKELTGAGGGPVQVVGWQLTALSDDDLDALERVCQRALAQQQAALPQPAAPTHTIDGESRPVVEG